MAEHLKINLRAVQGYTIVQFVGEARLDIDEAEAELGKIILKRPRNIVVDATQLTFCSSVGMRLLLNLQQEVATNSGCIKLVGLQPMVKTALGHARLLERFELCDTLEAALGRPAEGK
jgi:anti-anti-sigma factor